MGQGLLFVMPNHNPNGEAAAAAGKAVLYTQIVDGGACGLEHGWMIIVVG